MIKLGQEMIFVREKPPGCYMFDKPEDAIVTKVGKINFYVIVKATGATHTFRIETLEDRLYTNHKIFLTEEDFNKEKNGFKKKKLTHGADTTRTVYYL